MYTIQAAKDALKDGIEIYLQKNKKKEYIMKEVNRLPFYLEGSPGIGKTEIVSQIAEELGIGFVSFSLTHHTRNSLLGLPVIKDLECGKYTEYTMSEIIAKVIEAKESGKEEGILLLDEFSCVSDSILPAMLAFLQTKNIGMHTLPEGWVIVLCGNPPEYNRNARRFDAAILDRIRRLSVVFEPDVFLEYAQEKGFHPLICSYLKIHPMNVYSCQNDKKEQILVTCRGWENLSHALYGMEQMGKNVDESLVKQFIKSDEVAYEFMKFYRLNKVGMSERDIEHIVGGDDLQQYYKKYADKDFNILWNTIDVIGEYMKTKHTKLDEKMKMLSLGEVLIEELKTSCEVEGQIRARAGENVYCPQFINRWDKCSSHYTEASDLENQLLDEWIEEIDAKSIEQEEYMEFVDGEVVSIIKDWMKRGHKECKAELKALSKEISNVICFVQLKDETLLEKFYQIINHTEVFLHAVVQTKNREYVELCKKNYAVGA